MNWKHSSAFSLALILIFSCNSGEATIVLDQEIDSQNKIADPALNKTIIPINPAFGNKYSKMWITDTGRVTWFFVTGEANEGVITQLNSGESQGMTIVQYDIAGTPVNYGDYRAGVVRGNCSGHVTGAAN